MDTPILRIWRYVCLDKQSLRIGQLHDAVKVMLLMHNRQPGQRLIDRDDLIESLTLIMPVRKRLDARSEILDISYDESSALRE